MTSAQVDQTRHIFKNCVPHWILQARVDPGHLLPSGSTHYRSIEQVIWSANSSPARNIVFHLR